MPDPSTPSTSPATPPPPPPPRLLKRPLPSELFTDAATSFNPVPYNAPKSRSKSCRNPNAQRNLESAEVMPDLNDPDTVIIHPPFTNFPDSSRHIGGFNFTLLTSNDNWFLDANDFCKLTNPNAIPYPPSLEPPRGWCQTGRKELKARAAEGWTQGQVPKLRCTFCRRSYPGANAKSMWRRHILEKHKIPMANRRDSGGEKVRGRRRGTMKENRQPTDTSTPHESIVSLDVSPQTDISNAPSGSRKLKFKASGVKGSNAGDPRRKRRKVSREDPPETPTTTSSPESSMISPSTPCLAGFSNEVRDASLKPSLATPPRYGAQHPKQSWTPPTFSQPPTPLPYDPNLTPSFRHASPRLYQPWRFPSPTHPLHSCERNLSLTMLSNIESPGTLPPISSSPVVLATPARPLPRPFSLSKPDSPSLPSEEINFKENPGDVFADFSLTSPTPRLLPPFSLAASRPLPDEEEIDPDELAYLDSPSKKRA